MTVTPTVIVGSTHIQALNSARPRADHFAHAAPGPNVVPQAAVAEFLQGRAGDDRAHDLANFLVHHSQEELTPELTAAAAALLPPQG